MRSPERVFLTWLPYSRRSQTLAANFQAEPVYFRYLAGKHNVPKAVLRYLVMTVHTILLVLRRRPRLVFVMNQPIFLPLTLFLLHFLTRVRYVVDSHSGLFIKPQWRWSLPMMKYVYRYSLFSIVTNQRHRELVTSWGANVEVLGALSVDHEEVEPFTRPEGPCLVVIGTFAEDEPTREVIEAARQLPQVRFFVTGAVKNAPPDLVSGAPDNVTFTDFQPRPRYVGLVQAMDGAMILVKNDNVMQMGAYEAMSWAVPIVTSDWPVLRENFYRGAIFTDNSTADIVRAVRELLERRDYYREEIARLRTEKRQAWDQQIGRINGFIQQRLSG
ncbi:MAG: glycosyltransferase family 1 protein [Candidatus Zixiibacteriota bacterium]|nr:MAG: glycosyltransferase family 1 protein [candidate division Zixibacteria bacterium]